MEVLYNAIANQPEDLELSRTFFGIKYFIRQNEKLATHREWLLLLFNALGKAGREAILSALEEAQVKFETKTK